MPPWIYTARVPRGSINGDNHPDHGDSNDGKDLHRDSKGPGGMYNNRNHKDIRNSQKEVRHKHSHPHNTRSPSTP